MFILEDYFKSAMIYEKCDMFTNSFLMLKEVDTDTMSFSATVTRRYWYLKVQDVCFKT
jgi:hypothetical protein